MFTRSIGTTNLPIAPSPDAENALAGLLREHSLELDKKSASSLARRKCVGELTCYLVQKIAERMIKRLPQEVEIEDLYQDGTFGLLHAIDGYDPTKGVGFETYASPRIVGAMLDGLRARDWVPRLDRQRSKRIENTKQSMRIKLGRCATDEEIRSALGLNEEDYAIYRAANRQACNQSQFSALTSGAKSPSSDSEREPPIEAFQKATMLRPSSFSDGAKEVAQLLLAKLSPENREILELLSYRGWTLLQIAQLQGCSESNILLKVRMIVRELRQHIINSRCNRHGNLSNELMDQYGEITEISFDDQASDDRMVDRLVAIIERKQETKIGSATPHLPAIPPQTDKRVESPGSPGELDFGFTFFTANSMEESGNE